MDTLIVERKLDSLQRCLARLHAWPPPNTMGETFDRLAEHGLLPADLALRMKKAVGFRNIAVHAYDAINWDIVFAISTRHLEDFEAFGRVIASQLDR